MLQSKSGIILLGISLLFIVWDIWFIKKKRIYSIVVLLLVVVSFFLNFNVKALNGRYVNAIEVIKEENDTKKTHNSTSERLDLYKSSINLFVQSPIFGYGSGDAKDVLKSRLKDSRDSYLNSLNAHNQFFQTALSIGGIGLLVLLSLFIIPIIYAIRSKHYVLVIILINFAIGFLFEAMLERIMGVYAFSFILVVINLFIGKEKMKHLKKTK
jgi:O-antigen ligase